MERLELDTVGVYAYADSSHARDRQLWRGFLSYALPTIMGIKNEEIDQYLTTAVVYKLDDLIARAGGNASPAEAVRCISTLLAKEIDVAPEFALASLYEGDLPTRLHPIKARSTKKGSGATSENAMIGTWLAHLGKIQDDKGFIGKVDKWRKWLCSEELLQAS